MTEKRICSNCIHSKGIGFDFWCGEGHIEYEVFGAETNCPYYEYHDWSKGTPNKTEKRFTTDYYDFVRDDLTYIKDNNVRMSYDQIVDLLNQLVKENEQLKSENEMLKTIIGKNEQYIGSITHKGKWR